MVGGSDDDVCLGVHVVDDRGGVGDTRGSVAPGGFAEHLIGCQILDLLAYSVGIEFSRYYYYILAWADVLKPMEGGLQHRLAIAQYVNELLRVVRLANRPKATSEAAGHNDAIGVVVQGN